MMFLAIIPSIILVLVVLKFDTVEKEPAGLLIKLFFSGALTVISAMLLGVGGEGILELFIEDKTSLLFIFIDNFFLTALVEEGGKYFVLKGLNIDKNLLKR